MPSLKRSARATGAGMVALALAVLAVPTIAGSAPAAASPQDDLAAKQAEAAQLATDIAANGERISILDEQFNQTQLEIDQARQGIQETQVRLDAAEQRTQELRDRLAGRAAALYIGAANGTPADALDANDVSELSSRSKYGSAAADEDNSLIDELAAAKKELERTRTEFEKAKAKAEEQAAGLEQTRTELLAAQDRQQQLLVSAQGEIQTLVNQIELQRRAAEEARARAAALERAQQAARSASNGSAGSRGTGSVIALPAPNGRGQVAVNTAMAQLGKPYRYAAAGPSSFDCSGLTMFAWAAAGVRLPHSSAAQYASLPHVPQDQLVPGDLVFYGRPIHHVGIYIGGGQYVHAPHTGDVVKVASAFRGDYVGAARPG
jgi:peptidoglycan DL-endopeptidase CwlO